MAARVSILALIGAAALSGCGASATPRGRTSASASVVAGRRLFVQEHCGSCHALDEVKAPGGTGPDLDASARLTLTQLRRALTEGANGMPSYAGRLTAGQLDQLAAFVLAARHRHGG